MPFPYKMIIFAPSGKVPGRGIGEGLTLTPRSKNNLKDRNVMKQQVLLKKVNGGKRSSWIDLLKGIAIIAVVFYHLGVFKYGYLGVDLFLVINGYLITNSIRNQINGGNFKWFSYLIKRFVRLWPLIVIVCLFSLTIGYFTMLPDDLENLSESVVASDFFGNNILSIKTAKNYWDVSLEYKPMMHFWYIGILAQFYVTYIVIIALLKKISYKRGFFFDSFFFKVLVVLTLIGLVLYLTCDNASYRFYLLPYRFWEMTFGGLIVFISNNAVVGFDKKPMILKDRAIMALVLLSSILIFIGSKDSLSVTLLIITVLISGAAVMGADAVMNFGGRLRHVYGFIAALGVCSYSIFIWHQFIIAFYRYAINSSLGFYDYVIYFIVLTFISYLSYLFVEKKLNKLSIRKEMMVFAVSALGCVVTSGAGLLLYANAGVVRDVPELDICKDNIHRGMHAEYNDRIRKMNRDFSEDGKIKVLIVGHSFARDWANVLLESDISDSLDISYIYSSELAEKYAERISKADYIFSVASSRINGDDGDDIIAEFISENALWYGIGTKRYGDSNGNIYSKRNSADYFSQTVSFKSVAETYKLEKRFWTNYIDFIAPIINENGEINAFTDDNKYISQDTRHLTRGGAQYYARIFDLKSIFRLD